MSTTLFPASGSHERQHTTSTVNQPVDATEELLDEAELFRLYRWKIAQIERLHDEDVVYLVGLMEQGKTAAPPPSQTREEQDAVVQRALHARLQLIRANLRLVVFIVRRYANYGVDLMDLVQEGNLGLIHAVEKFDPQLGYKFSSYAAIWIRRAILQALVTQAPGTFLTKREGSDRLKQLKHLLYEVGQGTKGEPSLDQLAERMNIGMGKLKHLLEASSAQHEVMSLDAPLPEAEGSESTLTLSDLVEDDPKYAPEQETLRGMLQTIVHALINQLTPNEKQVLRWRYGLDGADPQAFTTIGKRMGITHEGVRQIELRALRKLAPLCEDLHEFLQS